MKQAGGGKKKLSLLMISEVLEQIHDCISFVRDTGLLKAKRFRTTG